VDKIGLFLMLALALAAGYVVCYFLVPCP